MIHVVYEGSDHCRKNYISRLIPLLLLFFFTSIKVLRFQRKTLYIVIALFLFLYYEGLPFSTLNLNVIALFLFHYYYYCFFCNFFKKKMLQPILMEFSDLLLTQFVRKLHAIFLSVASGPEILRISSFCLFTIYFKNIKDRTFKFLRVVENVLPQCPLLIQTPVVTSCCHRKEMKILNFSLY